MPIKPENRKRYPANWKDIRKDILKRADNKCEFCGIENYAIREKGSKVVLTIAHLDHTPENCDYSNLRALCQRCHNRYDAKHRAETRRKAVEQMPKWNASVGLQLTIDYEDIEADTEAEAIQIAKDRALEDIDYNNCECDTSNTIVYCCYKEDSDE